MPGKPVRLSQIKTGGFEINVAYVLAMDKIGEKIIHVNRDIHVFSFGDAYETSI